MVLLRGKRIELIEHFFLSGAKREEIISKIETQ
jgi:hypothetical protein